MKRLRILVVRIGAMGDVLHAMPAVAALRAKMPDAFIGWAIEPQWADLVQLDGDEEDLSQGIGKTAGPAFIDTWYSVPTRRWGQKPLSGKTRSDVALLKELLRGEKFDVVADLQGSIKSAAVGWMAGAKVFTGPDEPREKLARKLYRQRIPVTSAHVVEQACEVLGAAVGLVLEPAPVVLPMQPEHELWADQEVGGQGVGDQGVGGQGVGGRPFCLLAPAAGWGAKEWPPEHYGELAQALRRKGYMVLVNAVGPDDAVATRVVESSGDTARIVPSTLGQLIALTRRAHLVIGGDTGPVHLAAALGRPVVAIYGPTSPTRNGPWATRSRVLRNAESVTSHKHVKEPEPGLLRIRVEDVIGAALELLER